MRNRHLEIKRCAIYTRSNNHKHAVNQRVDAEHFVGSHSGWICLPTHYDDFGCSGREIKRSGLINLLADVKRGLIDHIVISRADRLARSVFDFMSFGRLFEEYGVNLVCVDKYGEVPENENGRE